MKFRVRARRPVMVEITPLVDVVFMLVIFFTVTTTFATHSGLRVDLPSAEQVDNELHKEKVLEVVVSEAGGYFFNQERVARHDLEEKLRLAVKGEGRLMLVIKADRNAKHGDVVHLMDRARTLGVESLAIAAEREDGSVISTR